MSANPASRDHNDSPFIVALPGFTNAMIDSSLTAAPMSRGCVLRAPGRPVDLDRYALRVGSRVDQVERNVRAGVGEQPRALAEDHGDDEQVDLVDQVVLEQPP